MQKGVLIADKWCKQTLLNSSDSKKADFCCDLLGKA